MNCLCIALAKLDFDKDGSLGKLRSALVQLGYAVRDLPDEDLGSCNNCRDDELLVLYLNATEAKIKTPANLIRKSVLATPSLILIGDNSDQENYSLLETCADFGRWPCPHRQLELRLKRIARVGKKRKERKCALNPEDPIKKLIGKSSNFIRSVKQINNVAPHPSPVLITGETGTGKELTARAIHYQSPRRSEPFIPVNCGALPETLAGSELFGHESGAFTDAKKRHIGLIEQANKGTLFLDEIDALSIDKVQPLLLRVVEDMELRRLGGNSTKKIDVRIIAASNSDLLILIDEQRFRADLYYRLNILRVDLPPLRRRDCDVELLSQHFLKNLSTQYGLQKRLSSKGLDSLMGYPWPGNVRELENFLHREYLQNDKQILDCQNLEKHELPNTASNNTNISVETLERPFSQAKQNVVMEFERAYLTAIMEKCHGNVTRAAQFAGKERRSFGRLIKKHGLNASVFRAG